MYLKYQNDVWTEPIVIYEKVWQTDGNLTGYRPITSLKMKMVGTNPHLLWQSAGGSGGCSSFNDQKFTITILTVPNGQDQIIYPTILPNRVILVLP